MAVPTLGTAIFYLTPSLHMAPRMHRRISGGVAVHMAETVRQRRDPHSVLRPLRSIMQLTMSIINIVYERVEVPAAVIA